MVVVLRGSHLLRPDLNAHHSWITTQAPIAFLPLAPEVRSDLDREHLGDVQALFWRMV